MASECAAIFAIAQSSPESSQWSAEEYTHLIAHTDAAQACVVAIAENVVAGFIVTRTVADEMEILNLAVAPQRRRQGIATTLLMYALSEAARAGARRSFLEVRESNAPARAFYSRHGFAESGCRRAYYSSPVEDAVVLSRALGSRP